MTAIGRDLRYAIRIALRQPGFSLATVLALALALGCSTALFSIIDATLLRPVPFEHPEQLVQISVAGAAPAIDDIRLWRSGHGLTHLGMWQRAPAPAVVDSGEFEKVRVATATEDFFETLGVKLVAGRSFGLTDTSTAVPQVCLIGYDFWRQRYAGSVVTVGRILRVDGVPLTVAGILPVGFYSDVAVWLPVSTRGNVTFARRGSGAQAVGRLREARSWPLVKAALDATLVPAVRRSTSPAAAAKRVLVEPLVIEVSRGNGEVALVLSGAVFIMLVITGVNVAGVRLAQGAARRAEFAVRLAIGARPSQVIRQLALESLLFSMAACVTGLGLARLCLSGLSAILPLSLPPNSVPTIEMRAMLVACGLSVGIGLLTGLAPAIRLSRQSAHGGFAWSGKASAPTLSGLAGRLFIGIEVGLTTVLLSSAILMLSSFVRLMDSGLGYDPETIIVADLQPVDIPAPAVGQYYASISSALRRVPGVTVVGAVDELSARGGGRDAFLSVDSGTRQEVSVRLVLPGYFEALNLALIRGRLPTDLDFEGTRGVAVINSTAARRYFGGGNPLDQIMIGWTTPLKVIGVVPDISEFGRGAGADPEVFVLPEYANTGPMSLLLRTPSDSTLGVAEIRRAAASLNQPAVIGDARRMSDILSDRSHEARPRHWTELLGFLASLTLILTLVGIFGTTAFAVTERRQDLCIRMALGATPSSLVTRMMSYVLVPSLLGVLIGLGGTRLTDKALAALLFDTHPGDPIAILTAASLMVLAVSVAAWFPARKVATMDSTKVLREV